jgi:hypothetical protein
MHVDYFIGYLIEIAMIKIQCIVLLFKTEIIAVRNIKRIYFDFLWH